MSRRKKIIRWIGFTLLGIIVSFGGFLGFMTIMDYKPKPIEDILVKGNGSTDSLPDTIRITSWNIGYGGLGKEQDFFFDGGKTVRPKFADYENYLKGIYETIGGWTGQDFIFLQEVDRNSKRSYRTDQVEGIVPKLNGYSYAFAINYNSLHVPQPLLKPYGKVFGGIATFSKYKPAAARRYALAADASWPVGLFMLKRCFMEMRYPAKNGKDLVLVNLHLSAYDDGTVKQQQMDTLKAFLQKEWEKGNYVIVGGDWNQFPPEYVPEKKGNLGIADITVPDNYPATGWKWVSDNGTPSNRSLEKTYDAATSQTLVIDYYLISPNVEALEVKGIDLGFSYSDHNPVQGVFVLKP